MNSHSRVGRPSLSEQRRNEIIGAFVDLVADRGLEGVTLDDVASRAGVQRAAIRHFVGNRDKLIAAGMAELTRRYIVQRDAIAGESPEITPLINSLFSKRWNLDRWREDAAFDALLLESSRNPTTRETVKAGYDEMLNGIADALRRSYPDVPTARIREVAYAIGCIVDQNTTFQHLGYSRTLNTAAKKAALRIASELGESESKSSP
ncbi:MAG: TetR/AcrR family transcriptional regulator [Mycolicibacterium sp.]|uniref:TetR/AcrR family transcriptional regulator n=1 Tax=Mycolicibacterium sp. TaxID=2320850 RepID=UPI003D0AEDE8